MAPPESGLQPPGGETSRVPSGIRGRLPAGAAAGAFFVVLVLALFSPSLLGGKVLSAGDKTWFVPPFSNDRPSSLVRPSNDALSDPVAQFHPDLWRARELLESGTAPLWNANIGAGRPLLASQQFAPLFPPQWLALVLPFWEALGWIAALKLLLAAVGFYLFCRELGLRAGPATLGGTTFAFSFYTFTWLQHPHTNAWSLFPWLFLLTRRLVRSTEPPHAPALGLSVLVGVLVFAGHPESVLIGLMAVTGYLLFELVEVRRDRGLDGRGAARRAGWWALAVAGGLLLSAVVTLPVIELFRHGFSDPRGGPPAPSRILLSWLFPELRGRPDKAVTGEEAFQEFTAYIGALPLLLGLGALASRPGRPQLFFAAIGALAVAVVLGTPINSLVRTLSSDLLALARLLVIVTFAGAVLAAFGVQRLVDASPADRRRMLTVMTVMALLPLIWLVWHTDAASHWGDALTQVPAVKDGEKSPDVVAAAAVWRWALIAIGGVTVLAAMSRLGPRAGVATVAAALGITATDLITLDRGYHPQVSQRMADPPAPQELQYARAHAGTARVMGADQTFHPNLAARYDVLDPRAYDLPAIERYQELFQALGGGPPDRPIIELNNTQIDKFADLFAVRYVLEPWGELDRNRGALPRAFMAYSWRQVTSRDEALFHTVVSPARRAREAPVIEFAPPMPDRSSPPAGPARITVDREHRVDIQVSARRPGYLVLHDTFYPGWHATVDGISVPILPANYNFRAVPVPAGDHTVSFRYRPASVIAGAAISAFTVVAMAALAVALWLRRRRRV